MLWFDPFSFEASGLRGVHRRFSPAVSGSVQLPLRTGPSFAISGGMSTAKAAYVFGGLAILLSGCAKGLEKTTALPYAARAEYQSQPRAGNSLFGTDEAVLHGSNIEQILTSKFVIPPKARLAIMRFGQGKSLYWWSEEFAALDQDLEDGMLASLRTTKRLADVSLLPSMTVPEKQTIPYLREAAARCQADLLIVYRSHSHTFEKSRFLKPDEVKAKCLVEAIMLDTRTGIVPFSSVSAQVFVAKKSKEDFGFPETTAKAELKATSMGLEKIAEDLARFLEALP